MALNQTIMNDFLADKFKDLKKMDKKSGVLNLIFLPHFILTNSVENVTHILKTRFDNYGKSGSIITLSAMYKMNNENVGSCL